MRRDFARLAQVLLLCGAGACGLGAVVPDLDKVEGIERLSNNEEARRLLQENGFVVLPYFHRQLFSVYGDKGLPHYATADSIHNAFHTIFEKALKRLEIVMRRRLQDLTQPMLAALPSSPAPECVLARDYFRVAECLLTEVGPKDNEPTIAAECQLIRDATCVTNSPLFGYPVDYTQFKPRGFYTENAELRAHFRAVSWFGNIAFRQKSPEETAAACLIARTLAATPGLVELWKSIDKVYTGFLGICDDLTPLEYASACAQGGDLAAALRNLRAPRINSMALSPDQMTNWQQETKGMRFFGKRYLVDSQIFQSLTAPAVPSRALPTGLDMMAANGSKRARELLAASPDAAFPEYLPALDKAPDLVNGVKQATPPTHYSAFLKMLDTLFQPAAENAPAFAKTPAYTDKNLMTSLAAWSCERHAWVLQAKQSAAGMGMGMPEPLRGYVEPNEAFFTAMHALNRVTCSLFAEAQGCELTDFHKLGELIVTLRRMVSKELAGIAFTDEENELLIDYRGVLDRFHDLAASDFTMGPLPHMGLVADVHTGPPAVCLEVATGGAMPIYVAVERDSKWYLCLGGVYSYYEFAQPIGDRLTNEEWRKRLETSDPSARPFLPSWTSSFVAPPRVLSDAERTAYTASAIAELRQGRASSRAESWSDPALDDYLEKAVRPDGELMGKPNHRWVLDLAVKRLGRKMVPVLIEFIRTAPVRPTDYSAGTPSELYVDDAAHDLREIATMDDLSVITALLESDPKRGREALLAAVGPFDKRVIDYLLNIARTNPDAETRKTAATAFSWIAGKDQTPRLLELLPSMDPKTQKQLLISIRMAWNYPPSEMDGDRFPSEATGAELRAMQQALKDAIRAFIDAHRDPKSDIDAAYLQGELDALNATDAVSP